ncbi:hypothetical protein M9H77_22617 [Catharanthus roseus]|uniref:Uncharacterized protein n=1 Tax=Catharanthus roseus TaxID=4058 RepID=A0ACC0AQZ2_CATRO|nr:hypothetical protein M9H77_22617 [Catharanthus roseus]
MLLRCRWSRARLLSNRSSGNKKSPSDKSLMDESSLVILISDSFSKFCYLQSPSHFQILAWISLSSGLPPVNCGFVGILPQVDGPETLRLRLELIPALVLINTAPVLCQISPSSKMSQI